MSNYNLQKTARDSMKLMPSNTYYSDEYAKTHCELFLSDKVYQDEGGLHKYYRLHAMHPHTELMSFKYDICCPKCGSNLKQVAPVVDEHELGLYVCPLCDKMNGGRF